MRHALALVLALFLLACLVAADEPARSATSDQGADSTGGTVRMPRERTPGANEQRESPMEWWCAQEEHADSPICKKFRLKNELRHLSAAERARLLAARKDEALTAPTKDQIRDMRTEEREMLQAFCARPERKDSPICADFRVGAARGASLDRERWAHARGERYEAGDGPGGVDGRGHDAARQDQRPPPEFDLVSAWWCASGGHPDFAQHADSIICAAWNHRKDLREVQSEEERAAVNARYHAYKENHRSGPQLSRHEEQLDAMLLAYCAVEGHETTRMCVKWMAHRNKQEL
mmetsp:Transcript_16690/g.51336  ORF Transcript_16690/g.51336 Transcript_16690/m.51336 type:complete len:291 (+) Transcript_16690:61-933(+)